MTRHNLGRGAFTLFSDFYVQISLLFGALLTAYVAVTPIRIEPNQFTVAVALTMIAAIVTRVAWLAKRKQLYKI